MRAALAILAIGAATLASCEEEPPPGGPLDVIAEIGEGGRFPGQFGYPRAIDGLGDDLVVIDKLGRVQVIDPDSGKALAEWVMPRIETGKPTGVTVAPGPEGEPAIYVPDTHQQRVLIYAAPELNEDERAGEPPVLARFGSLGTGPGEFRYLTDVAVLTGAGGRPERIYVSEYGGNDRVSVFDPDYNFLFSFGAWGRPESDSEEILFDRPQSVEIVGDRVVVTDSGNHRLGVFTLDGELVRWVHGLSNSPEAGAMSYPYGLAPLADGTVLVAEYGSGRLRRVDLDTDSTLGIYGRPGRGEGEIATPWGVAVIGRTAFALDSGNNRIFSFRSPERAQDRALDSKFEKAAR